MRTVSVLRVLSETSLKSSVSCGAEPSSPAKLGGMPATDSICTDAVHAVPSSVRSRSWQLSQTISSSTWASNGAK